MHLDCYWQVAGHWSDLRWDAEQLPRPGRDAARPGRAGLPDLPVDELVRQPPQPVLRRGRGGRATSCKRADGSTYVADVWHGTLPGLRHRRLHPTRDASAWFQVAAAPAARAGRGRLQDRLRRGRAGRRGGRQRHDRRRNCTTSTACSSTTPSPTVTREVAGHVMVWARSSFLGGQRHSAQWGGDTNCSYPAMASTLRGGLSHGLAGVPFWSHDAGGFTGTPTPDLYVRGPSSARCRRWCASTAPPAGCPGTSPASPTRARSAALRLRYRLHALPLLGRGRVGPDRRCR